jgi:DNA-binding MarR family transcriptional regulator
MSTHIHHIIDCLFTVDKAMHEQLRDAEAVPPLTLPEAMALSHIERSGAVSITDLALHFGVRKSSISVKIAKLERQGLVIRDGCLFDKRSHTIQITDKAREKLRDTKSYIATYTAPLFSKLTIQEQQQFITLLEKIIR